MQYIAFDSHKYYTVASVERPEGGLVRVRNLRAVGRYDGAAGRLLLEDATIDSDKIKGRLQVFVVSMADVCFR